jgi:hypothetical protein
MKMGRRAFLGLSAAAAMHPVTRGLPAVAEPIVVNFDDIRIGQWADFTHQDPEISEEEGPFFQVPMHPLIIADLMTDKAFAPILRKCMRVPLSGGEAI